MIPVILSGGSGTRLWPLSRSQHPKQFLSLVSNNTMIQDTVLRLQGIEGLKAPLGVCNENHRFMMAEQLREIGLPPSAIILEPVGKNTAPAVALAALTAGSEDDILLVLPADHIISNVDAFQSVVKQAEILAKNNYFVTFGIVPDSPETGYGYIKNGDAVSEHAFSVAAFVEKPNALKAQEYMDSGDYLWNSGMFAFKAGCFLEELEKFNPEMLKSCKKALDSADRDEDFIRVDKAAFMQCPADSIDYAVMEKTAQAVVIPLEADWNDVGSWSALLEVTEKDEQSNAISGDVIALDTEGCYILSERKLLTTIGLRDLIIVETDDAVMIAAKDRVQDVKKIVDELKNQQRTEAIMHTKVYRPWGYYQSIDKGNRHKTKLIVVKPGAKLSLQKHHHRAEHWVIVKGTALVTKNKKQKMVSENESVYIPLGVVHCLENPGVIPLEIIEIQTGSYLNEDDIVRIEDKYGRV